MNQVLPSVILCALLGTFLIDFTDLFWCGAS